MSSVEHFGAKIERRQGRPLSREKHVEISTNNVEISLSKTGGVINSLKFPTISEKPIINTTKSSANKKIGVANLRPGQIFTRDKIGNEFALNITNLLKIFPTLSTQVHFVTSCVCLLI